MAPPQSDDNARGEKSRRSDSVSPGAYAHTDRAARLGRRRWGMDEPLADGSDEAEYSAPREISYAARVIDTVAEPGTAMEQVANSNDSPLQAEAEPFPRRSRSVRPGGADGVPWTSPFAAAAQVTSSEPEPPPLPEEALRPQVAPPPARARTSWLVRAWVVLMCAILGAALLIALRSGSPRRTNATDASAPATSEGAVAAPSSAASAAPMPPAAGPSLTGPADAPGTAPTQGASPAPGRGAQGAAAVTTQARQVAPREPVASEAASGQRKGAGSASGAAVAKPPETEVNSTTGEQPAQPTAERTQTGAGGEAALAAAPGELGAASVAEAPADGPAAEKPAQDPAPPVDMERVPENPYDSAESDAP